MLELDITSVVDIKVDKVEKGMMTGLSYPEVHDAKHVHYRPVVECTLSPEHEKLIGVKKVWVDMDGLAADDACESLLKSCILKMRKARPDAPKEWIKLLSSTQVAWAGTGKKNLKDGEIEYKLPPPKQQEPEVKKEESKEVEDKKKEATAMDVDANEN